VEAGVCIPLPLLLMLVVMSKRSNIDSVNTTEIGI
jgi:hypothetical protein